MKLYKKLSAVILLLLICGALTLFSGCNIGKEEINLKDYIFVDGYNYSGKINLDTTAITSWCNDNVDSDDMSIEEKLEQAESIERFENVLDSGRLKIVNGIEDGRLENGQTIKI